MPISEGLHNAIQRYLSGIASESDKDLVNEWYHSFSDETIEIQTDEEELRERVRQRIKERLSTTLHIPIESEAIVIPLRKRFLRSVSVAASLVLIIGGIYWYRYQSPGRLNQVVIQATPKNDAAPGTSKAILTLADGSSIVLDSTGNGRVSQQGSAEVVKLDSGLLAYHITYGPKRGETSFNTITTPKGGQYQVILPDGSKVWLNAASSLRYPVSFVGLKQREVSLIGEAYFEVAKDSKSPFIIQVRDLTVQVLGTNFNVNAYPDEPGVNTTLLDGSVRINRGNESRLLYPGEQAREKSDCDLSVVQDPDVEEDVAWKNEMFNFNHINLYAGMRQIERWYNVEVVYEGNIPDKPLEGSIHRNTKLSMILKLLNTVTVHCRLEGKTIFVTP